MGDVRGAEDALSFDHVVGLLQILDGADVPTKIEFRNGPLRIKVERGTGTSSTAPVAAPPPVQVGPPLSAATPPADGRVAAPEDDRGAPEGTRAAVRAPIAGVFYRAPRPGAEPFVAVGQHVDADAVVGIIEVMKLMNTIRAGIAGVVAEICAGNAELVEFGQVLVRIEPDEADT